MKLKELCKIKHGFAFKGKDIIKNYSTKYVLVTPGNFNIGGGFKKEKCKYFSENGNIPKDYILRENDLIVTMTDLSVKSDTLGYSALIPKDNNIYLHNQRIGLVYDIDESKVLKDYLYWFMRTKKYQQEVVASQSGTAIHHTSPARILNIEIDLPSIDNQRKIVKILSDVEHKIKNNNDTNNNLQELINNIFISKFVNYYGYTGEYETTEIGDIPSNWKVDNLGNVISFSNGYGWNSKDMLENNQPDTYKVFKMGNIKIGGGINKEKTRSWILKEKCSGLEQFLSKKGDILMCMTDMKSSENPLLGHTALIDCDDEFVINQRVGIIRCDKDIRWPYIYTMTNLPFFINNIRSKAHSGVQVNLTTSGICDTKVLIPDKYSLEEFYKNVTPMYEEMFILNNEIEKLEELRDTLLPKLMNGEIDLDNIEI